MITKLRESSYLKKRTIALITAMLCIAVYGLLIMVYMRYRGQENARGTGVKNSFTASVSDSVNPILIIKDSFTGVFHDVFGGNAIKEGETAKSGQSRGIKYVEPNTDQLINSQ